MVTMWSVKRSALLVAVLVVALVLFALSGWAQQPEQESSSRQGQAASENPATDTSAPSSEQAQEPRQAQAVESSSTDTQQSSGGPSVLAPLQELGRARSIQRERSPLQWGPIFVSNASAFFISGTGLLYDQNTNTLTRGINHAGVFTTNLIYAHEGRRSNFAFQYQPEVTIINGGVQKDLTTNSFSYGSNYILSRRWTMSLHDTFSDSGRRLVSGEFMVDVNAVSGTALQKSFLDLPQRSLSDNFASVFSYALGRRDELNFEADYIFLQSPYSTEMTTSHTYGGRIEWSHALSANQSVGLFYSVERRIFDKVFPDTLYNQVGGSYSVKVSATLQLHGNLGVSRAIDALNGKEWTATGEFGLLKRYGNSLISLGYYRGNSILPIQTNRFVDRVDIAESYMLSRRWHVRVAFGHQRSGGSSLETLGGSYSTVQTSCKLNPWLTWLTTYSHIWQPASATLPGYSFVSTGLQWTSGREAAGSF